MFGKTPAFIAYPPTTKALSLRGSFGNATNIYTETQDNKLKFYERTGRFLVFDTWDEVEESKVAVFSTWFYDSDLIWLN